MTKGDLQDVAAAKLFREAELRGERSDLRGSFDCYLAAAKLGNPLCQVNVGDCYSSGRGVRKDLREAARWYRRAYRNGMSHAAINLSVNLRRQGNLKGAIIWLKRAVSMDDGEACLALAKIYLGRSRGKILAVKLLGSAATSSLRISEESKLEAAALLRKTQVLLGSKRNDRKV